jgi:hypothetical protein
VSGMVGDVVTRVGRLRRYSLGTAQCDSAKGSLPMKPSSIHRIARSAIGARNYTSPPSTTTFCCKIPHRSLLAVTGPQAHPFLNGLVTTPIPPNPERLFRNGFYSAFLTPQVNQSISPVDFVVKLRSY